MNLSNSTAIFALTVGLTIRIIRVSDLHLEGRCTPSFEVEASSIV